MSDEPGNDESIGGTDAIDNAEAIDRADPIDSSASIDSSDGADEVAPNPGRVARSPLTSQVLRFANKVHATLKDWNRQDLGDRITAEAGQWSEQHLVVVACGDIKRGKSSLLNALLDRTQLLPVDADVATSVHLVIRYGQQLGIVVTRLGEDGQPQTETVGVDDLIDVASMRGDPAKREGVISVEISIDHPLLARGIVLIDTPGVGGMSRGHRDLALSALARADALLFTISAQEPVARSELEFLAEASERTDRVVLVVTKSDVNTDEINGSMIAEHRAKLATFAQTMKSRAQEGEVDTELPARMARLTQAPVVLTSSYLAEQAQRRRAAGREEQADRLMERSGLGELVGLLEKSADNREIIRLANLLSLLRILLADVEREAQAQIRALSGDTKVTDELHQRQIGLEEFGSKQARWRTALGNSIVRLQTNSSRLVTRELNRVKEHYREMIETSVDAALLAESLPNELERSLHGAWSELVNQINDSFRSTLGALLAEFGADGMDVVLGSFEMPEGLRELSSSRTSSGVQGSFLDDGLPVAMQTFTFANIANAAAKVLGFGASGGLGLIAYGIGAAIAYPIGNMRKKAKEKQRLKGEQQRFLADVLFGQEGVAKEFTTELSLRILDLREEVEKFVEQRLAERRKQLESEARDLQMLLRAEAGKRQEVQKTVQIRLRELGRIRADLEPLQRTIDARLADTRSITREPVATNSG